MEHPEQVAQQDVPEDLAYWYSRLIRERASDIKSRIGGEEVIPLIERIGAAEARVARLTAERDAAKEDTDDLLVWYDAVADLPCPKCGKHGKVEAGRWHLMECDHCYEICAPKEMLDSLRDAAYQRGQEEMRERAAKEAAGARLNNPDTRSLWDRGYEIGVDLCVRAIRALPVKEGQ